MKTNTFAITFNGERCIALFPENSVSEGLTIKDLERYGGDDGAEETIRDMKVIVKRNSVSGKRRWHSLICIRQSTWPEFNIIRR